VNKRHHQCQVRGSARPHLILAAFSADGYRIAGNILGLGRRMSIRGAFKDDKFNGHGTCSRVGWTLAAGLIANAPKILDALR
jgi:hypothetical protein